MIPPPFNFISARVRGDVPAFWRYWTLVHRILAVNILPILIVALGILWLDAYRTQLRVERVDRLAIDAEAAARASATGCPSVPPAPCRPPPARVVASGGSP